MRIGEDDDPQFRIRQQSLMWAEFRHTLPVHLTAFLAIGVVAAALVRLARVADTWRKG